MIPGARTGIKSNYTGLLERAKSFRFAEDEPEFVVLDTETTGFDARTDALIEVAAAIVCGNEIVDTFSTFVNPGRPIPLHITEITAINDADVANAPTADAVMRELVAFCGEREIIAHNAPFDQGFIRANCKDVPGLELEAPPKPKSDEEDAEKEIELNFELAFEEAASETSKEQHTAIAPLLAIKPWIDTVELARIALPLLREHNLETLSAVFAPESRSTHRAIDDVLALTKVWRVILVALSDLPEGLCSFLAGVLNPQPWSSRQTLAFIAEHQAKQTAATDASARQKDVSAQQKNASAQQKNASAQQEIASAQQKNASARQEDASAQQKNASAQQKEKKTRAFFDLIKVREALTKHLKEQKKVDADELEGGIRVLDPVDTDELAEEYSAAGLLGMMYTEYETRHEQVAMAQAVAKAFNSSGFAAIEAGTGVGKSMAYLLPAALFAKQNGVTCGVATKSNALLDQLMYSELPRLNTALEAKGLDGLEYLSLKGYDHYPCLRKLLKLTSTKKAYKAAPALSAHLLSYVSQSVSGDIDAINARRGDVPRYEYIASADDCLGHRCRYYCCCLLHSMRRQAKCADVIVTNHSLLYCDVVSGGSILPPVRHWVIDEAHGAEGEARRQLSSEVEAKSLTEAVGATRKGGGLLDAISKRASQCDGGGVVLGLASKSGSTAEPTDALVSSFFSAVAGLYELGENSDYNQMELWLNTRVRESAKWSTVLSTGRALSKQLEKLVKELKDLISAMSEVQELSEHKSALAGHTMVIASALETLNLILDGTNTSYVYSALLDKRSYLNANKLVASYYDVGAVLAEAFYPNQLSVVYTSATIALGGSAPRDEFDEGTPAADFGFFKRGVGLNHEESGRVATLKLDSSYDFDTNMAVFVPTNMIAPNEYSRRSEYLYELDELLFSTHMSTGGSVLTLFTNRREMEETYERLRPAFEDNGLDVVCQYAGTSRTRLREKFINDEALSLFALRSFWEGFDAPGDTLRCVIIPKLPFGRPTDPLQLERDAREKGAWSRYVLPEAVISLKQAAGRLIRSSSDSGYLILADSRLVSKFYGKQFLAALPSQNIHYLSIEAIAERMRRENEYCAPQNKEIL